MWRRLLHNGPRPSGAQIRRMHSRRCQPPLGKWLQTILKTLGRTRAKRIDSPQAKSSRRIAAFSQKLSEIEKPVKHLILTDFPNISHRFINTSTISTSSSSYQSRIISYRKSSLNKERIPSFTSNGKAQLKESRDDILYI